MAVGKAHVNQTAFPGNHWLLERRKHNYSCASPLLFRSQRPAGVSKFALESLIEPVFALQLSR